MKIIFWGNGNRGVICLQALLDKGYEIELLYPSLFDATGGISGRHGYVG